MPNLLKSLTFIRIMKNGEIIVVVSCEDFKYDTTTTSIMINIFSIMSRLLYNLILKSLILF